MTEFNTEHANWKELSGMNIFNAAVEPGQSEFVLRNSGGWCWKAGQEPLYFISKHLRRVYWHLTR